MSASDGIDLLVSPQDAHKRLDALVAQYLPSCSRSFAAALLRSGHIVVDGVERKPSYKVKAGERVTGDIPPPDTAGIEPEAIALDVVYEDHHLIVLNKPAGLVVHPAAGHPGGTLVNALLYHCPDIEGVGGEKRPGIVHRLDKNTSGIMVVSKTALAHQVLSDQFRDRRVRKTYAALVLGEPDAQHGAIDLPIGRHPIHRKKMSTVSRRARDAVTQWRIRERFGGATLLDVDLKTGRTHQIRVHCSAMGHPIVGDTDYGGRARRRFASKKAQRLHQILAAAGRQMLHARRLSFVHPDSGERLTFDAPLARDMKELIDALRRQAASG